MNEILKLLAKATELIEKLNDIITQHDIEINELTNKVKELQNGQSKD
ncbi:MAG TPA: hypothetical protein PLP51_03990 [Acholeplasmataceae bacterium]|nr:hypothetical protein [Acholeplasmataceae bacterium]